MSKKETETKKVNNKNKKVESKKVKTVEKNKGEN